MTDTRIYVVLQRGTNSIDTQRVVEASSAAQAIRHCVRGQYSAYVPNTKELADMLQRPNGPLKVERALEQVNEQTSGKTT